MPFKIVITETRAVRATLPKRWLVVSQKIEPNERCGEDKVVDVYGHTPETETVMDKTVEVLSQEVETIDLISVIKAVNNIP